MFGEHIVDENVERSNNQATVVIRINADQWNLTTTKYTHSLASEVC